MSGRRITSIALACIVLFFCSYAWGGGLAPCSKEEAMQALAEADGIREAEKLYKSYQLYSHCDDGAIAEGYSNAVAMLLTTHWEEQAPKLLQLAQKDSGFRTFILHHIDEMMTREQLALTLKNASSRCPEGMESLCSDIRQEASKF